MKKILGSLFLLLFIASSWVSAQCPGIVSPEPTCIRTMPNGDVQVDIDISSMGGTVPTDIDRFELYASATPTVWPGTPVFTQTVGSSWPAPTLFHVGANGATNIWYYKIVAWCVGPPQTALQESSVIRNIRLTHNITNDFEVNLNWNWDTLSTNLVTTLQKKQPAAGPWSAITPSPSFVQGSMSYTDTVKVCKIAVNYQVTYQNLSKGCASQSNETDSFTVQDLTPPNIPVIDTVSFDEVTNRPLITWDVNAADDVAGYVVLYHPSGDCQTANLVDTVKVPPSKTRAIDNKFYNEVAPAQYAVYAYDGCASPSNTIGVSQKSECVNSMQLTPSLDVCEKSVRLDWTPYNGFKSGLDVLYKVFVSVSGSAYQYVGSTTELTYLHDDPVQNQILTYKIVAVENGGAGPKTTSSNRVEVDAEFLRLPEFAYLRYATVADDNYVRLELYTDTKHDVGTYVLKRALDTNDVYTTVNVFHAPDPKIPSDSITPMSDRSPITDRHQYYYKVDMFDTCGAYMMSSNFVSTMLLKISVDNVRRVNRLEWANVWGWFGKTFAYKIYRFLDGVQLKDPLTKFPDSAATTVYYDSLLLINDNITQGNPSRGKYTYYIEAIENEPSFRGSPPAVALSNEVTVVQEPYISSVNAFTPNGDGKNEKFKPTVIYHDLSKYEFYVMNRFGDIIYSTTNAKASWDGTANGKPAPVGVYVYSVKYQSSTGQQFEDRGTVSLLR